MDAQTQEIDGAVRWARTLFDGCTLWETMVPHWPLVREWIADVVCQIYKVDRFFVIGVLSNLLRWS